MHVVVSFPPPSRAGATEPRDADSDDDDVLVMLEAPEIGCTVHEVLQPLRGGDPTSKPDHGGESSSDARPMIQQTMFVVLRGVIITMISTLPTATERPKVPMMTTYADAVQPTDTEKMASELFLPDHRQWLEYASLGGVPYNPTLADIQYDAANGDVLELHPATVRICEICFPRFVAHGTDSRGYVWERCCNNPRAVCGAMNVSVCIICREMLHQATANVGHMLIGERTCCSGCVALHCLFRHRRRNMFYWMRMFDYARGVFQ